MQYTYRVTQKKRDKGFLALTIIWKDSKMCANIFLILKGVTKVTFCRLMLPILRKTMSSIRKSICSLQQKKLWKKYHSKKILRNLQFNNWSFTGAIKVIMAPQTSMEERNFIAFEYHKRKGTEWTERFSNIRHSFTQNESIGRQKIIEWPLPELKYIY